MGRRKGERCRPYERRLIGISSRPSGSGAGPTQAWPWRQPTQRIANRGGAVPGDKLAGAGPRRPARPAFPPKGSVTITRERNRIPALDRPARVAIAEGPGACGEGETSTNRRRVAIELTAPSAALAGKRSPRASTASAPLGRRPRCGGGVGLGAYLLTAMLACISVGRMGKTGALATTSLTQRASAPLK